MSRSRRGKKAGEDAERLLQEAFGVSEDQLLKDFILAQTEVKDSDIPPGSEDGFERLMAKLEAEVGTSPESEKESSSEKEHCQTARRSSQTTPVENDCESPCSCRRYRSDGCGDGDFGWGEEGVSVCGAGRG